MLRPKHCKSLEVRPKDLLGWLPMTRGLALYYSLDRVGDGVVTNLASDSRSPSADLSAVKLVCPWTQFCARMPPRRTVR